MARPKKAAIAATASVWPTMPVDSAVSAGTPLPHPDLQITVWTLSKTATMHRVHQDRYGATDFNPLRVGNSRFSPIADADGNVIPTIYAASTLDAAAMETVYHDVPFVPGRKTVDEKKLYGQMHSQVQVQADLKLADLSAVALRKLGVSKTQLIETQKDQYPRTRLWAEAIYRQHPHIQGLSWVSRQDDAARAVILFGDRIPAGTLTPSTTSRSLWNDPAARLEVLLLADRIGVNVLPD
jgi:hypothetical protein